MKIKIDLPLFDWLVAALVFSLPFYLCWTACGIGEKYFYFVPQRFQVIPFWDCVGLFVVVGILGAMVNMISPKLVEISNKNANENKSGKDWHKTPV